MLNKELAKINKASLIISCDILTFNIWVSYETGSSQCVGGIALDTYNKETEQREGTAFGCELIRQLLKALNVNDFSEMKGKIVWVYGKGEGIMFNPIGIGGLSVDGCVKPVIFQDVINKHKKELC